MRFNLKKDYWVGLSKGALAVMVDRAIVELHANDIAAVELLKELLGCELE